MSCHQVDVLLCKYNTCKYYYSVYNELLFFHFFFFFQASQRRVPAKNNPWATGVRPIYLCKFVLIPLYTRLSFQSLKKELKQSQKWLQWKRHYKIYLRSFTFHFLIMPPWFPNVELLGTASIFNDQRKERVRPANVHRSRASARVPLARDLSRYSPNRVLARRQMSGHLPRRIYLMLS